MGGNPRKGVLFEGPPGTGKTYMAKAMAREAGVPFLFVSSTAFQSMYYGADRPQDPQLLQGAAQGRAPKRAARSASSRRSTPSPARAAACASTPLAGVVRRRPVRAPVDRNSSEGISGVVNELLIQLQSFDTPTGGAHASRAGGSTVPTGSCPRTGASSKRAPRAVEHPASSARPTAPPTSTPRCCARVASTARSTSTCRAAPGRREIIDYYLDRKAHVPELDKEERRDALAAMTFGYTPVMIEHLFDEALVWALRDGAMAMDWRDVQQAKMTEEIGLKQPVEYTDEERRTIATHEAGHATVAYLVGQNRKLEVLSIIKRRDALGLLAHSDGEERFTRTRSELLGMMKIAFGGMSAEELFFGESGTGPSRRPRARDRGSRRRWSARSAWPARSCRTRRSRPVRSRRASSARCSATRTRAARSRSCSRRRRPTCRRCSTTTGTS